MVRSAPFVLAVYALPSAPVLALPLPGAWPPDDRRWFPSHMARHLDVRAHHMARDDDLEQPFQIPPWIGAVIGVIALLVLLVLACVFLKCRKCHKRRRARKEASADSPKKSNGRQRGPGHRPASSLSFRCQMRLTPKTPDFPQVVVEESEAGGDTRHPMEDSEMASLKGQPETVSSSPSTNSAAGSITPLLPAYSPPYRPVTAGKAHGPYFVAPPPTSQAQQPHAGPNTEVTFGDPWLRHQHWPLPPRPLYPSK